MESTLISIVFRSTAVLSGLFLLIFSFLIYRKTREATKGWFYLSFFGISLFCWSASAMLLKIVDLPVLRHLSGIIFLMTIAFFLVYAYSKLADDFWIGKPKWINARNSLIGVVVVLIVIWGLNLLFYPQDFSDHLLGKLLSIAHQTLAVSFLIACLSTFYLGLRSKNAKWWTAFVACLLVGLSMNLGSYYDGCCGQEGKMIDDEICSEYDLDYMRVYDIPCNEGIVGFARFYQLGILLATIFIDISFFLIWKGLD